ncbi:MAG: hypothetical protein J0M37_12330 [Ignavibacteria bacterium]|nr:hypothetical protein [Ignavibacteria bacterium]
MTTQEKNQIVEKLDIIIAILLTQGKERDEQIKVLAAKGFSNADISGILGIPKGTIDGIRAKLKK